MLDYLRIMIAARSQDSERGASAVEYGLLIAGIAALIVVVVFAFGDNLTAIFDDTCNAVTAERHAPPALIFRSSDAEQMNAHELWLRVSTRSQGSRRLGTSRRSRVRSLGRRVRPAHRRHRRHHRRRGLRLRRRTTGMFQDSCSTIMEDRGAGSCR